MVLLRTLLAASVALPALAAHASMNKTLVRLPPISIPAGTASRTIEVDVREVRSELLAAAKDRSRDVVLDLKQIEADRNPEVFFEISVGAPKGPSRSVGNLALYGVGIRSEARGQFLPAHVQLVITDALSAALRKSSTVAISFVAQGAGGSATPARSVSAVRVGNPSIFIAPRTRTD